MPVDPRLQPILDAGMPVPATGTPAERRAAAHAAAAMMANVVTRPAPDVVEVFDDEVPVEGGAIAVRVYRPDVEDDAAGCLVYLHGGGWWMGTLDLVDPFCRRMAVRSHHVVVSVDYRLAPEHPFPVPLEDSYAALRWTVGNATRLGIDPARVTIGGESAGANLAAAVTLLARDRCGPALCAQLLVVPAVDLTGGYPSRTELGTGYGLNDDDLRECTAFYVGAADPANPLVSPIFADLHDLPPALILTAEYDPIRDEGEAYGVLLEQAGNQVKVRRIEGVLHGSVNLDALVPDIADDHDREIGAFLQTKR